MRRADGRGEVLAAGTDGAAESGGEGHLHRLRGWAERISGSHRSSVSAHRGAALHRACGTGFAELRALETAQTGGRRSAIDLSRGDGGRGRAWPPRTGKQVESLSQREPGVAAELGTDHAVFQLPAGHPPGDLHYQQRGVAEPLVAQDHQNSRRISQRRGGAEVAVSRFAAGSEEMDDAHSSLAVSAMYASIVAAAPVVIVPSTRFRLPRLIRALTSVCRRSSMRLAVSLTRDARPTASAAGAYFFCNSLSKSCVIFRVASAAISE